MFTQRTYTDIAQQGEDTFVGANPGVTDLNDGSVIRTILETFWLELSRYNTNLVQAVNDAQEAATYLSFGFGPLPASAAYGSVLFSLLPTYIASTPLVIPAGSRVSVSASPRFAYTTTADVSLTPTAPLATAMVVATDTGALYNIGPNTIDTYSGTGASFVSVTNPRAFIAGADAETEAQRRVRFGQFIVGLPRGTKGSILYGLKTTTLRDGDGYVTERVLKASTIEFAPGEIHCWVHNGVGDTSPTLVAQAQQVLDGYTDATTGAVFDGYKAAGIHSIVFAATEIPVTVTAQIELQAGYLAQNVIGACEQAVSDYLQSLDVGESAILESVKQAIRTQQGVLDIVSVASPTQNIVADFAHICVPGNISISTPVS